MKEMALETYLKKAFALLGNKKLLSFVILAGAGLLILSRHRALFFALLFISISSVSKIYHRFFRSTLGIDLVLFTSIMTALAYKNSLLSLFVAYTGLILADIIGSKFSHTSIISLIGLTIVVFGAGFISGLPFMISALTLIIVFEIITALSYVALGSSPDRIIVFLVSHFLFNLILILSISEKLLLVMI